MSYRNLVDVLHHQAERLGSRPALRYKQFGLYHDVSWSAYREQSLACGAALIEAGVRPGDRVGLLAENRVEWLIADMGILAAGGVNVPPHAPLTSRQVQFQFADAGVSWLFVSTPSQLAKVQQIRRDLPELRGVVVFDGGAAGDGVLSWPGFLQRGRRSLPQFQEELQRRRDALTMSDLATIMYTSGTTGNPKGVMLTHGNLLSNACAVNEMSPRPPETVILNWLPFSHIYARTVDHYLILVAGVTLCLAESAETVVENLAEVQPMQMSCVPRFYEKVLTAVACDDVEKSAKRLKAIFGPRVTWLSSGGAPLPPAVAHAYHDAGVLVLQGYGLTESSPVISFNRPDCYKLETVGKPVPGVEVAISKEGEVLTRGPHVMPGYWNNPQATAEAIRDGWLYTGDLGSLDSEGFLSITGRKKELMVLSNGKKVVPSVVENLLLADVCIDQVVVYGEGKNFLTALVVPHWENLVREMCAAGVDCQNRGHEELACLKETAAFLEERAKQCLQDVAGWENVKKLLVLPQAFSVAAEEMTVSLKLRRSVIYQKYRDQLEGLYREG